MSTVVVEVVVGLAFRFFLLSIVASALSEAVSGVLNLRGNTLRRGIGNLVVGQADLPARPPADQAAPPTDPPKTDAEAFWRIHDHPMVNSYGGRRWPSYLSAASFRSAVLDATRVLDVRDAAGTPDVAAGLAALPPHGQLRNVLTAVARTVDHDPERFPLAVEQWYDRSMERVSGWYKRNTQVLLFVIGVALALAANANAGQAALRLWTDDAVRGGLVAEAQAAREDTSAPAAVSQLRRLDFPVGWAAANRPEATPAGLLAAVGGWVLTGIAVTFGAPFWFDLLGRVSNLRAAGRKPESVLTPAEGAPHTRAAV